MANLPPLPPGATLLSTEQEDQPAGLPPLPPGASLVQPTKEEEIAAIDPEAMEDAEWGDIISKGIQTAPQATMEMGKQLFEAVKHPIDTTNQVANMVAGFIQKAVPGKQTEEPAADLMIDFMKDRYGSIEGLKKAIATDLPGVISDIAGVAIPGGQAVRGLGTATKMKTLAKIGDKATKVAQMSDLPTLALEAARFPGKVIMKDRGLNMYQEAARFSKSLPRETRIAVSQLAVDEAIMPTVKGLDKVRGKINILNDQISDLLERGVSEGKTIPINALFTELQTLRKTANIVAPTQPVTFRRLIDKVAKEMHVANKKINNGTLTLEDVQRIKQNIYKDTGKFYDSSRTAPLRKEVQKAISRAAKQSLENVFPELKDLNKKKGAYRDLLKAIDDRADAIDASSLAGLGTLSKMGLGGGTGGLIGGMAGGVPGAATGSTIGTALGLAYSVYSHPRIKAKLAIAARQIEKLGKPLSPAWTELGIAARQPERIREE